MAYERQLKAAMDRLDVSLARLHSYIKRGENKNAITFMTEGELKIRYEELQNIINISSTGGRGSGIGQQLNPRGTKNVGSL